MLVGNSAYNPAWAYNLVVAGTDQQRVRALAGSSFVSADVVAANAAVLYVRLTDSGTISSQRTIQSSSGDIRNTVKGITTDGTYDYLVMQDENSGNADLVVAKMDSTPAIVWQRSLGLGVGGSNNFPVFSFNAIAVDSSGNVFAGGYNEVNVNSGIAKWNSSGTIQWQKNIAPGTGEVYTSAVATDSSGNSFWVFQHNATPTRNSIIKIDSGGTVQWQRYLSTSDDLPLGAIAVDASGNVYTSFRDQTSSGWAIGIVKYDTSGTLQWQKRIYNSGAQSFNGVAKLFIDGAGNLVVAGSQSGSSYGFISSITTSGTLNWQRTVYMTGGASVATDLQVGPASDGSILMGGYFNNAGGDAWFSKIPTTGLAAGTYTGGSFGMVVAVASFVFETSSYTSSTASLTVSSGSYVTGTPILALTASSYTLNKINL